MLINFILKFSLLMFTCVLTPSARTKVITYKSENSNNCDISLDLSNTGLKRLAANFINSNCVKRLFLQNNSITNLEESIFNTQPYLEYVDLSNNQLLLQHFFSYGGQSSLKVVILDDNNCNNKEAPGNFENTAVQKNAEDEDSISDGQNITKINALFIPHDFPNLEYLSLRNDNINSLPAGLMNRFPKLKHLDLSDNPLTEDSLSFLIKNISSSVNNLVLENVGLKMLRTEQLNFVEEMNLNRNTFIRISSSRCHENFLCLEYMDNLKYLSISNCSVTYMTENAFKNLKNLLGLDISNNRFWRIAENTFSYLPSLLSLDLSENPLETLPNFSGLQNLTTLTLNNMKEKKILQSLQSFTSLPNLKYLSMNNNQLLSIPPTLFDNLSALEKLDLSNNKITSLPSWDSQKCLHQLDLSSNKITNLDDISLQKAEQLELLVLKNNSISTLKVNSLKDLPSSSIVLNL